MTPRSGSGASSDPAPRTDIVRCSMTTSRLAFSRPPFDGSLEPATFFMGTSQEESLARLEWLVEKRQRLGLVVGESGCGKSHLAAMAVRRLGGLGAEAAMLPLRGLAGGDWLEMLLDRLPLDAGARSEPLRSWQKLDDRLRENTLMERPTVLVFDDLDRGPADAAEGILRLISSPEPRHARVLVVATAQPDGLARLPDDVVARSVVRIELAPWKASEIEAFLDDAIRRAGGPPEAFSPDASMTVARLSGGVPRVVCQLAGLALAAAAGDGLHRVDASTVERSWRELSAAGAVRPGIDGVERGSRQPTSGDAAETAPTVRAVKRLFG